MIHTITLIHKVILFDSQASNLFELQPALTYGAIDRTGYIDHIFSFERIDFCMFIVLSERKSYPLTIETL